MNPWMAAACICAIAYAVFPLKTGRFLLAWGALLLIIITVPISRADDFAPAQGQMSLLRYDQFKDVFMMAKCVEADKASRADFAYAYNLLKVRDPMAVMAVEAGGNMLPRYLGTALSIDLMNTVNGFAYMQGKTLDVYCEHTTMRAMRY